MPGISGAEHIASFPFPVLRCPFPTGQHLAVVAYPPGQQIGKGTYFMGGVTWLGEVGKGVWRSAIPRKVPDKGSLIPRMCALMKKPCVPSWSGA